MSGRDVPQALHHQHHQPLLRQKRRQAALCQSTRWRVISHQTASNWLSIDDAAGYVAFNVPKPLQACYLQTAAILQEQHRIAPQAKRTWCSAHFLDVAVCNLHLWYT